MYSSPQGIKEIIIDLEFLLAFSYAVKHM